VPRVRGRCNDHHVFRPQSIGFDSQRAGAAAYRARSSSLGAGFPIFRAARTRTAIEGVGLIVIIRI
jgi:hypothetical protein